MSGRSPLISAEWLESRLDDPCVSIVDASWHMPNTPGDAMAEFAQAHIPGAVFFGIDEICDRSSELPHMLSAPADFAS